VCAALLAHCPTGRVARFAKQIEVSNLKLNSRVKLVIVQEIASQKALAMTETNGHYFFKTQ